MRKNPNVTLGLEGAQSFYSNHANLFIKISPEDGESWERYWFYDGRCVIASNTPENFPPFAVHLLSEADGLRTIRSLIFRNPDRRIDQ